MADEKKSGGSGFGGFGSQPGVREIKTVSQSTEIKIPRLQFLETWVFMFVLMLLGYGCLKLLIVSRGDWALLIGILTVPALVAGWVFFDRKIAKRFFPRAYLDFLRWSADIFAGENLGPVILYVFISATIIYLVADFYIGVIVPQVTLILDQQGQFVFVFLAFLSLFFAFIPYYQFNKRQLTDSLRDSDSHYASRALELEYERRKNKEEIIDALYHVLPDVSTEERAPIQAWMIKAPVNYSAPPTDPQERFKVAVMDFLDGIDDGAWGTDERSWRNEGDRVKILERSRFRLLNVGHDIRDKLIETGWARWRDEDDRKQGWELAYTTDDIRKGAFQRPQLSAPDEDDDDD